MFGLPAPSQTVRHKGPNTNRMQGSVFLQTTDTRLALSSTLNNPTPRSGNPPLVDRKDAPFDHSRPHLATAALACITPGLPSYTTWSKTGIYTPSCQVWGPFLQYCKDSISSQHSIWATHSLSRNSAQTSSVKQTPFVTTLPSLNTLLSVWSRPPSTINSLCLEKLPA